MGGRKEWSGTMEERHDDDDRIFYVPSHICFCSALGSSDHLE